MRATVLFVSSTAHLPIWERIAIEHLIDSAPRDSQGGRLRIEHDILAIEAHQNGFLMATAVDGSGERPDGISPALWSLLGHAAAAGAAWIMFDHDEPPTSDFPVF